MAGTGAGGIAKARKIPIPKFSTREEAARFFDTHDTTTLDCVDLGWKTFFEDEREGDKGSQNVVHVPLEMKRGEFRRLTSLARKQGQTPRQWLQNAVHEALRMERRADRRAV